MSHESESPELEVLDRVQAKLERDTRLDVLARRLTLRFDDGVLTVDGEVGGIASKKRALRDVATVPEVRWVVDHLRVAESAHMQDGEIRDHVRDALLQEVEFDECALTLARDGEDECARQPAIARGSVRIGVETGVVALDGDMPSWSHRRLAGVLAWWVPGTRDVENRLSVVPPEMDNDGELSDGVRLVLEKEPLVDADQVRVGARDGKVTLSGAVTSEEQKRIAERDAWYVLGVYDVVNDISVTTLGAARTGA